MPFISNVIFVLVIIYLFDKELVLILIFIWESHLIYFSLSLTLSSDLVSREAYLVLFPLPAASRL